MTEFCGVCIDSFGRSRHANYGCKCVFPMCDECYQYLEKTRGGCLLCKTSLPSFTKYIYPNRSFFISLFFISLSIFAHAIILVRGAERQDIEIVFAFFYLIFLVYTLLRYRIQYRELYDNISVYFLASYSICTIQLIDHLPFTPYRPINGILLLFVAIVFPTVR